MIEEIARHLGYERLGRTVPSPWCAGRLLTPPGPAPAAAPVLVGRGITEAMPMPFLAPGELARGRARRDDGITIANPLVAEQSVLRTSLLPGLVEAVAYNWSHRNHGVAPVRDRPHLRRRRRRPLPDERECLGVVLAGREGPAAVPVLQEVVAALGLGDRMQLAATGRRGGRRWPGCTRDGAAS